MAEPFLSALGVPALLQARSPTIEAFPERFNPNNRRLWNVLVTDHKPTGTPGRDWGLVVRAYIDECTKRGLYPFQSIHQSTNDQTYHFLKDRRREVVRFINKSKLFNEIKIRDSKRKVSMTDRGFVLEVYAIVQLKDPSFKNWLMQKPYPNFDVVRKQDGRYMKPLGDGLSMFVYNDGANLTQRWHIGYIIECPFYPDIPGVPLASKGELERFVLDTIWMPILKMHRPDGVIHRLI
ncbi:hypothetical protein [Burkholderia phage BCSR5]|nr:hypothetical protein [Burkholderia phage BCSR5]